MKNMLKYVGIALLAAALNVVLIHIAMLVGLGFGLADIKSFMIQTEVVVFVVTLIINLTLRLLSS